jgi:hypothetical protein
LVSSTGQIDEAAVRDRKSKLVKSEVAKVPLAIKHPPFTRNDKNLEEFEVLHVLSVLPKGEELDQLENGYILIGCEKSFMARLYYLHKDKKHKLVECHRGDLTSLCEYASELQQARLSLDRKQQREFIITPTGGHNHQEAKAAPPASAPVLPQSQSSSQPRSGSFSVGAPPQKKFNLEGYRMVLLKDGQDWPDDDIIENRVLYFKWNKSTNVLTVRHKLEDRSVFNFERPITLPKNIKLVGDEFERYEGSEKSEAFEVTTEAGRFLQNFAENPNPKISHRMSIALPRQNPSQQSDVPSLSSSEKGKEKDESSNSLKEGEKRLSSSPKASFYVPLAVPQPTSTDAKIEEADVSSEVNTQGMRNSQ